MKKHRYARILVGMIVFGVIAAASLVWMRATGQSNGAGVTYGPASFAGVDDLT